jgi:soluble lytic murein transglycosylase
MNDRGRYTPGRVSGRDDDNDTAEHQAKESRAHRGQAASRGSRGYWVGPEEHASARPRQSTRPRSSRRRVLVGMSLSLVVLAALAIVASLVLTGEVVVPGISDKLFPIRYQAEIAKTAQDYDQDPYLVAAIIKTESGFDAQARSGAGAVGLMQLMPDTAEWVASKMGKWDGGSGPDLTDPSVNLELGVWYLAYLGDLYGDGSLMALAAYNAGLGHVDDWIQAAGGPESFDAADIQYQETRQYLERVEHYRTLYARAHPDTFAQTSP